MPTIVLAEVFHLVADSRRTKVRGVPITNYVEIRIDKSLKSGYPNP